MDAKRENWNGKYRSVVRDKGKLVSWSKWSQKNNLRTFKTEARKISTTPLTNVREISDLRKTPRIRKDLGKYQAVIEARLKNGKTITTRSLQHNVSYPLAKAKEEVKRKFLGRLSYMFTGVSDANEGKKLLPKVKKLSTGVVQYREM